MGTAAAERMMTMMTRTVRRLEVAQVAQVGGVGSKPKVKVSRFFIQYSTFNIQSGVLFRVLDGYQPVASYQHHVTYYLSISS
jgi:hypothetical protein